MPRQRGKGSVYQRVYRDRSGKLCRTETWSIKYNNGSKVVCESLGTKDRDVAEELLKTRLLAVPRDVRDYLEDHVTTSAICLRELRESSSDHGRRNV